MEGHLTKTALIVSTNPDYLPASIILYWFLLSVSSARSHALLSYICRSATTREWKNNNMLTTLCVIISTICQWSYSMLHCQYASLIMCNSCHYREAIVLQYSIQSPQNLMIRLNHTDMIITELIGSWSSDVHPDPKKTKNATKRKNNDWYKICLFWLRCFWFWATIHRIFLCLASEMKKTANSIECNANVLEEGNTWSRWWEIIWRIRAIELKLPRSRTSGKRGNISNWWIDWRRNRMMKNWKQWRTQN